MLRPRRNAGGQVRRSGFRGIVVDTAAAGLAFVACGVQREAGKGWHPRGRVGLLDRLRGVRAIPRNRDRHPRLLAWRSLHAACSGRLARAGTHVGAWASSTGCAVSGRFRGIMIDTRGCWRRAPCSRQVAPGAGQAPPDHRRTARKPDRFASAPGRRVPAMSSSTTPESCQEVWIRCGDTPGYDLGRSRGGSVSERAGQRRVARCQQRPARRDHGTDHSL